MDGEVPNFQLFDRLLAAHEKGVAVAYEVLRKGKVFRGAMPEGWSAGYDPNTDPDGARFFQTGFIAVRRAIYPEPGGMYGPGGVILEEPKDARPAPGSFIIEWDNLMDERAGPSADDGAKYALRGDGALDAMLGEMGALS